MEYPQQSPFFFAGSGIIASTISSVTSLINSAAQRKHAVEMNEKSYKQQLELQRRKEEFDRDIQQERSKNQKDLALIEQNFRAEQQRLQFEFQLERQLSEFDFQREKQKLDQEFQISHQERNFNFQLDLQEKNFGNQYKLHELQSHLRLRESLGALPIPSGTWREHICPNDIEPLIIFDTVLRQDHKNQDIVYKFNPMIALAQKFKEQNSFLNCTTVIETHEGFLSEAHARLFYNKEFPQSSVIIVYGDFLGNNLHIHAVCGGIMSEQFILYENGGVEISPQSPRYISLGRFPKSMLDEFSLLNDREINTPKSRENEELLLDIIANVALQSLVDHRFGFFPEIPYTPKARLLLEDKLNRLKEIGLERQSSDLAIVLRKHSDMVNGRRDEIEESRQDMLLKRLEKLI